jgi:alpha-1,2-mannosyltransferase
VKAELGIGADCSRKPLWPTWVLGAAFIICFACNDYFVTDHGIINHTVYWGHDFVNVWTGGHLVRAGHVDELYDLHLYSAFQRSLFGPIGPHNYSYPPVSYPLAAAFSLLPYWLSLTTWLVGTGALFVFAARKWWPEGSGPGWLAVLTPAAVVNIWAGHYGFLVGALFLLGWTSLDDHPKRAGFFFGLMLIKPHLAVLVPLVLVIRREWTAITWAAAVVGALLAVTTLWFGYQPWLDFLFRTSGEQAALIDARDSFCRLMSTSTATALFQVGAGWRLALAGQTIVALGGIGMVSIAAWRRMPTRELALLTATCTFLVLPYAFNYDLTVVALGALTLLHSRDARNGDYRLGWYGFLSPQLGMIMAAFSLPLMPAMLLGLAAAQFRCWSKRQGSGPQSEGDGITVDCWSKERLALPVPFRSR